MIKKVLAVGSHVLWLPNGTAFTSPAPGTSGRESKPDASDSEWLDLGYISAVELDPQQEEKEVWAASPGQLRLVDIIEMKRGLNWTMTLEEVGAFAMQLAFKSLALAEGGGAQQYNPTEGSTVKGWMKIQQYDDTDTLWNTVDLYSYVRLNSALNFADDVVRPQLFCRLLQSTLNTGQFA